ncbi:MAG TPA: magnesium transporter [Burkholderiales bacterium]|jgi:magnesium transporter
MSEDAHASRRSQHAAETAGWHLVERVPLARSHETAGEVIARLPGHAYDYAGTIFLADEGRRLLGAVPLPALLKASPGTPIVDLSESARAVHAGMDQEHIASHAIRHNLSAVPVTDAHGVLLGVVPPMVLLEVLRHEHVEDIHRLAGIKRETAHARTAIEAPPVRRARDRLPWLLIGLAGSVVATFVVASFERALQSRVAIAFFIPGIVYLADAIGTQTEAIAVRGLSLSHAPLARLVLGELRTGLLIGSTLGLLSFPAIWLAYADVHLALAVSLSLLAAGAVATTVGLLLPWLLAHTGRDPAFGSGPIATIIQDVLSLLIYFAIASLLLL